MNKEQFKKMFPKLAKEMELGESKVGITSFRSDVQVGEKAAAKRFAHYTPDVIDFIRRCDNEKQAEEIVAYMEKRREISQEYAERLRKQIKESGVRSFGPKKEDGYYFEHGEL